MLQDEDKSLLINLGFAACLKGEVGLARKLFAQLQDLNPPLKAARAGEALSYIVTDEFIRGEEILKSELAADPENYELKGILVLSYVLQQRAAEARILAGEIPEEAENARAFCNAALMLLN